MNYTAFENRLNTTNPQAGDIFDFMAGGDAYDAKFAGGSAYSGFGIPQADYRAIFINDDISMPQAMSMLNEDFTEFVLNPMQIIIDENSRKKSEFLQAKKIGEDIQKVVDFLKTAGFSEDEIVNTLSKYTNQNTDSNLNMNSVEIAKQMMGFVTKELATSMISSLGITGYPGLVASWALAAAMIEAIEVQSGLDISYGFGGDIQGIDELNQPFYDQPLDFTSGFKNSFGIKDVIGLVADKTSWDYNKQIVGVRVGSNMINFQVGDNVVMHDFASFDPTKDSYADAWREWGIGVSINDTYGFDGGGDGGGYSGGYNKNNVGSHDREGRDAAGRDTGTRNA